MKYRELNAEGIRLPFDEVEFRNQSQNGEDGILHYIFSLIGAPHKTVVEICAGDGIQCNAANLLINHGWTGLLVEGDEARATRASRYYASHPDTFNYPPTVANRWVTKDSVNDIIREAGYSGEVDLLSLDLDGVDFWIWQAIEQISPRVVVAEVQAVWGAEKAVTVPYRDDFSAGFHEGFGIYSGASLPAFVSLARARGYRLIGVQRYGYNAFFLRNDIGQKEFPEVPAGSCFDHPFTHWAMQTLRPMIADREWIPVDDSGHAGG